MSVDDLEKEYSPSLWSKRFPTGEEVLENHLKFATAECEKNRLIYKCRQNVSYGEDPMEKMDIYFKNTEEGKAIFVYVHGGYWQFFNKDVSAYCVSPIVEKGHRAIVVDYDLCPKVTIEGIANQIKRAVEAILEYAHKTAASSVSLCGHSAGAHLLAYVLGSNNLDKTHINLLKCVHLISGVYDLTTLRSLKSVNPSNILSLNEENSKLLSPMNLSFEQFSSLNCHFYVFVAENDSRVFIEQSKTFYHLLHNFKVDTILKIIKNCDHFDIVENLVDEKFEITQTILAHLN